MQQLLIKLKQHPVLSDTRGLASVEYVVILVLIVAIAIATWQLLGSNVTAALGNANNEFKNQVTDAPIGQPSTGSDDQGP